MIDSEVLEGIKLSHSDIEFQDIKNLKSFILTMKDLTIDYEISEQVLTKYYELCRSQNSFLHKNLVQGLNSKLIAGIISETVNIADAIRASKLSTPRNEFEKWEKSLKSFKQLGMNIGFLLSRVEKLLKLAFELEQAFDLKKYREAIFRKNRVRVKILELKTEANRLEREIKILKVKAEKHELTFQGLVNSPW